MNARGQTDGLPAPIGRIENGLRKKIAGYVSTQLFAGEVDRIRMNTRATLSARLSASLLAVALLACGGGERRPGGGDAGIDAAGIDAAGVSSYPSEISAALCAYKFRCCSDLEIMEMPDRMGQPFTSESECDQVLASELVAGTLPTWEASAAHGRASFTASGAAACVASFDGLTCGTAIELDVTACNSFMTPLVADGGACSENYECTSGWCDGATVENGTDIEDGVCTHLPQLDEECADMCAPGLVCGFGNGKNECFTQYADGSDCIEGDECMSGSCTGPVNGMTCAVTEKVCTGR